MYIVIIDSREGVRLTEEMTEAMEHAEWTLIIEADGNTRVLPHEDTKVPPYLKASFFTSVTEAEANRSKSDREKQSFAERHGRSGVGHDNEAAMDKVRAVWAKSE